MNSKKVTKKWHNGRYQLEVTDHGFCLWDTVERAWVIDASVFSSQEHFIINTLLTKREPDYCDTVLMSFEVIKERKKKRKKNA